MDDRSEAAVAKTAKREAEDPWGIFGGAEEASFFCVRVAGERYAFDAPHAEEVIRLGTLTRLPAAPSFLLGVFQHRGEILAVLDLGQLLVDHETSVAQGSRSVIVQAGSWRLALMAESIEGLIRLPGGELEPPPSAGTGSAALLAGVGRDPEGPVAILDLERLIGLARERGLRT